MDFLVYILVRVFFFIIRILPYNLALFLLGNIALFVVYLMPKYRGIGLRNLEIAFPDSDIEWRKNILKESCFSLGRLVLDFAHLPSLTKDWLDQHVDYEDFKRFGMCETSKPKGIIFATGHLGSFELLACVYAQVAQPLNFVARNFPNQYVDKWWSAQRMLYGNKSVSRKGAFKEALKVLTKGDDLAILFDQNVTINHATFVDFFNVPAATTKTPAVLAIRTSAPVFAVSLQHLGNRRYKVHLTECNFKELYSDAEMSYEDKINKITKEISLAYENMIKNDPASWFWMHRRWKTRPPGENINLY